MSILIAFAWLAALWFGLHWSYVALMAAKRATLTPYWKVMLYPLAVPALLADVAFNFLFGTIIFAELPKELMFSSRVQRHADGDPADWQHPIALWWAKQLNVFDDHIKVQR